MKNSKKIIWGVVVLVIVLVLAVAFKGSDKDAEIITLSNDGTFTHQQCESRGLVDKVIMMESKYCHVCELTKPTFLSACEAKGVTPLIIDISKTEDFAQMESFGINIKYTPTFVFGCDYYVGEKSKLDYENYLDKFMAEQ
ncbi:MAG: hypothetical protein KJ718_02090 [Nanoarchaeota archaeon]|nr:hypothetical protein [Nanoarchaeota archaeon]MBU1051325.1 hypothetical protein [Nanoarchaeota archaeon]MBU1988447.1 hypothetical protein [Nanoarchaeota archaeon]